MKLEITKNPSVQAYAHHAYVTSIIEGIIANEEDGLIMKIKVLGESRHSWINKSKIIQNEDCFAINEKYTSSDLYEYVYRECDINDELVIRIDILQNKIKNSILNLAITGEDFNNSITQNQNSYKCGYLFNRLLTRVNESFVINQAINQSRYRYIKLRRQAELVSCYISIDGEEWKLIEEFQMFGKEEKCNIGFIAENLGKINLREQYSAWLYSNFIQIRFDETDIGGVFLDYWNFPLKNIQYEKVYANNFLEISYEEPQEIMELCGDLKTYINWCIRHEYYIAISLDEYYIEARSSFGKKHYHHHNLIFGYDEERDVYEIMGYDQKIIQGFITGEQIVNASKKIQGMIIRYKFLINNLPYEMDINYVYRELYNLKMGNIAMNPYGNILKDKGYYGRDALEYIIHTENGREILLKDKRVSFLLYEHAMLMKERLLYMREHEMFSDREDLILEADSLMNQARQIMNLVVKNNIKPIYTEQIFFMYEEWYRREIVFIDKLILDIKSECDN